ncbi:hypothetical protein CEUSTIGMA_g11022.t1 [Chlamydomonas eustigma]|uniref:Nucleolar protein 16 n=1 Tax=Chlamydomonas eustigma TaxID=1157962 RepID=A0A250XKL2_9CHLO|nr:hypothetical protein CEUSTIGMA_g11022.t1 [Chlamydomonas eustigma]|eukprot:GAX83597.1 hypothetical protein CEUSTIGMA_g11022.t1 [Chlamydomonas eustigma]
MAGSRRRLKKDKPKVKVGLAASKRKRSEKSKTPLEVAELRPSLEKRLNSRAEWEQSKNLVENYAANHLVLDPNQGFGRNKSAMPLKSREVREKEDGETYSDDDELRAGCNLERKTGKAPPPKLTTHQRKVVEQLIEKHGEDIHAMVLDIKLNAMQHSAGQLKKLILSMQHWRADGRHDFRAPRKQPKNMF